LHSFGHLIRASICSALSKRTSSASVSVSKTVVSGDGRFPATCPWAAWETSTPCRVHRRGSDFVIATKCSSKFVLLLARVREITTPPTTELPRLVVKLDDTTPAGDSALHARAEEIRPAPSEPARSAEDRQEITRVLPLVSVGAPAIVEDQAVGLSGRAAGGHALCFATIRWTTMGYSLDYAGLLGERWIPVPLPPPTDPCATFSVADT
jgi:hypothetical protein